LKFMFHIIEVKIIVKPYFLNRTRRGSKSATVSLWKIDLQMLVYARLGDVLFARDY
jgi:hypothetical protein